MEGFSTFWRFLKLIFELLFTARWIRNFELSSGIVHFELVPQLRQKRRQRSSLLLGGRTWITHQPVSSKDDSMNKFWKNIHFGRVVVLCVVNRIIIPFLKHLFRQVSVLLCILFFKSSWCWIFSAVRYWINSVPPNQRRRPSPSLLSDSSSMVLMECVCGAGRTATSPTPTPRCATCSTSAWRGWPTPSPVPGRTTTSWTDWQKQDIKLLTAG